MGFFGGGGAAPANMVGATSSAAGTAGLVPAPAAGQENLMLKGGGLFGWIYPPSTDIASSEYHGPNAAANLTGISSSSLQASRLYLSILLMSGSKTFNRIGFRFGNAASCDARIGLYECDTTNFRPSSLVVGSTALNGSTNTNIEFTISPSITLKNKIYFGALIPSINTSMNANGIVQYDVLNYLGCTYTSSVIMANNRIFVDFNYAALPSDLSSYTIKVDTNVNAPIVYLRNV
jgi:hypothetical protein